MAGTQASRIADLIVRDFAENQKLRVGDRLPSIRALVERYGTSVATVGSALGQLEARGIVSKRRGSGCFLRAPAAQPAPNGALGLIGVIVTDLSGVELSGRLHDGVQRAARRRGCNIMVACHSQDYTLEQRCLTELIEAGCQAVIMVAVPRDKQQAETDYLRRFHPGFPLVLVDMCTSAQGRMQVQFDNAAAGYEMTRLLLDEGHEHIAFVEIQRQGRALVWPSVNERRQGFLAALSEAGRRPRDRDFWVFDQRAAFPNSRDELDAALPRCLEAWLGQPDPPTAVIAHGDILAVALIQAAQEAGVDVPDALRVAGFDNLSLGHFIKPAFPTTDPDFGLAGEKAVELAHAYAAGELRDGTVLRLPVPLLPRRDSAARVLKGIAEAAALGR